MKRTILYFILGVSLILNFLLGINSIKNKSVCKREHLDEINKKESIIPNEKIAERIASTVIDAQDGNKGWTKVEGYDVEYDIEVSFDKKAYEWVVHYLPKADGYIIFGGEITVRIRKDNGMMSINKSV